MCSGELHFLFVCEWTHFRYDGLGKVGGTKWRKTHENMHVLYMKA